MSTKETIQELKTNLEQLKQKILDLELSSKENKKNKMIVWFNKTYNGGQHLIDAVFQLRPLSLKANDENTFENKGWIKAIFDNFEIWFCINLLYDVDKSASFSNVNIYVVKDKKYNILSKKHFTCENYYCYPLIKNNGCWDEDNFNVLQNALGIQNFSPRLTLQELISLKSMFYHIIGDKHRRVDKFIPKLNDIRIENNINIEPNIVNSVTYKE